MTSIQRVVLAALGLAAVAIESPARAGGLYLNEFATPSMSVAGAGAQAVANDASTAFHNPAGMTRLPEGYQLMLGLGGLYADVEFDPDPGSTPGNDGGNAGGAGPILSNFYVRSLSDRWRFGINLISISAAVLDYDNAWTGRYLVQDVSVFTINLNPTLAYRVNDWLSVGVGGSLMYAKLDLHAAIPPPPAAPPGTPDGRIHLDDIDDFAGGFNAGLLVSPREGTRFGLIYQSKIEPDLRGSLDISLPPGGGPSPSVDTKIPFVEFVRFGFYQEVAEKWAVLGTIGWENWSDFDEQFVNTSGPTLTIKRKWHDTQHYALGVHYRLNDAWLLQAGMAYDTSPVKAHDRTPDLPIDRQLRYSVGAQHQWSEKVNVGVSFEYADYGNAKIRRTATPALLGDYQTNEIFFLAFNVNWKSQR